MTQIQQQLLTEIRKSGENGVYAVELADKLCISTRSVWANFNQLKVNGLVKEEKEGDNLYKMYAIEYAVEKVSKETKEITMETKEIGGLEKALVDAMAKYAVDGIVKDAMPLVREKCIKEFGMTPVVHEIRTNGKVTKKIKGELPPVFHKILKYSSCGNPVMMTGPAGTGKGYLARKVAEALDAEFFEVNAVKNEYGLTGFVDANSRFVRTPFYDACKAVSEGKKAVFLFDEMDCSDPEVLKIFNEALSSFEFTFPNDEHLNFEDLIILSACNTFGTGSDELYCGQQLDASTLNRFVIIRVDYNRKVELSIAQGDEELVDFIDAFRRQTEKNGMLVVVSYRNLKQIVSMYDELPLKDVMKDCLIKSMNEDDLRQILDNMSETENLYYRACKGENVQWKPREREDDVQGELELTA